MKLATVATTAAFGAALAFASGAYAQGRNLQVIHCDEAWNVMSPDGLALAAEVAGEHLIGASEVDIDGNGQLTGIEFRKHCEAGKAHVVPQFPCCR
ncbi:MAG: hypothetical protein ACRECF_10305 [Methyloceanibacter sp.]